MTSSGSEGKPREKEETPFNRTGFFCVKTMRQRIAWQGRIY